MEGDKVDYLQYMGFQSYKDRQVATKKPGVDDYYVKDAYTDIGNYHKRKIPYFDDKLRYDSIYMTDYLKTLREENYTKPRDETLKIDLGKYEYSESPTCVEMICDKTIRKNEPYIRSKFEMEARGPSRTSAFSQWETTYDHDNKVTDELKKTYDFKPPTIDDHFKQRYHRYHTAYYRTEGTQYEGVYGDDVFEKFFWHNQPKIHSSNYQIGLGTTKPTTAFIPGYGGFIPVNRFEYYQERIKDPYFNVNKANHLLNFKVRIPDYMGYIPQSVANLKGNARPFCLTPKGETFN